MSDIRFKSVLDTINTWTIIRLPLVASKQLTSRGIVMVKGTIDTTDFHTVLEPDGKGSHWFNVPEVLLKKINASIGDTITITLEPVKEWTEPTLPDDLRNALAQDAVVQATWDDITPMARWDWIRWINATSQPLTRQRRIEVTRSKLSDGKRRPCCFNRNECTVPEVSKSGVLLSALVQ